MCLPPVTGFPDREALTNIAAATMESIVCWSNSEASATELH
jgi:hypothetical protein